MNPSQPVSRSNSKIVVVASHRLYPVVLKQLQLVVLRNLAVILQRLLPSRLHIGRCERYVTNLEEFRRGEENHVRRIVKQGVYQAAFIQNQDLQTKPLSLNRASHARGPGANDEHIRNPLRTGIGLLPGKGIGNMFRDGRQGADPDLRCACRGVSAAISKSRF